MGTREAEGGGTHGRHLRRNLILWNRQAGMSSTWAAEMEGYDTKSILLAW